MAHFYGKLQGNKGETTRLGSKSSGITATINSWDVGVTTQIEFSKSLNTDVVYVYDTKGSNGIRHNLIISYAYIDDKFTIINNSYPELFI